MTIVDPGARATEDLMQWPHSFDLTSRGIAMVDPATNLIERVNPAFAAMHGGEPADFAGRPIGSTLDEPWRSRVDELARRTHEQGLLRFQCERVRLDGTNFPADVEVVAGLDPQGGVFYRLAYVTDLTELRAREAAERLAIARFERAFEDAPVGMLLVRAGQIERANAAALEIFGRDHDDIVARDPRTLVHPDDAERAETARSAVTTGEVPPSQDRRILRPDGRVLHTRLTYSMLHGPDEPDGPLAMVVISDRTAEVEAEQARQAALRLFSTAVDQAPIGMCLVGLDGRFLRVNSALCRLFGRSQSELLETTFQELTHPHDLEIDLALMRQCLEGTRDGYGIPKRYLRADGEIVDAFLSVSLIRTSAGDPEHFVSQIVDVTELHAAEQQLQVVEDRDRIARALHDHSIQRLFAVGLTLQAVAAAVPELPEARARIESAIGEIDGTIKGIRSVIYRLRAPGTGGGTGVRDRLVQLLEELTPRLGHHPQLRLSGPLEVALPEDLVQELLSATREALQTVARNPEAAGTDVSVTMDPAYHWVELEVLVSTGNDSRPPEAAHDADTRIRWQVSVD